MKNVKQLGLYKLVESLTWTMHDFDIHSDLQRHCNVRPTQNLVDISLFKQFLQRGKKRLLWKNSLHPQITRKEPPTQKKFLKQRLSWKMYSIFNGLCYYILTVYFCVRTRTVLYTDMLQSQVQFKGFFPLYQVYISALQDVYASSGHATSV